MKKMVLFVIIVAMTAIGFWMTKNHKKGTELGMNSNGMDFVTPTKVNTNADRKPAGDNTEQLNRIIYGINSKDDVDPAIDRIQLMAKENPNSDVAQIYAAILGPLKVLKGIIYRLRFLVEPIDMLYIASINQLRMFKRNNSRRAKHIDALFDYLVEPNPTENIGNVVGPFVSMHQLQDFMAAHIAPKIQEKIKVIKSIAEKYDDRTEIFDYDAGLLIGESEADNMTSQTVRMRKVMPAHLMIMVANMQRNLGIAHYIASYNLEDTVKFINSLTAKTLLSKKSDLLSRVFDIHLQSPKEFRDELFRSEKPSIKQRIKGESGEMVYKDFLTLRKNKAQWYLPMARRFFIDGVTSRIEAFEGMQKLANLPNQNEYFLNARLFVSRPGITLPILRKRKRLLEANSAISFTDRVSGKSFSLYIGKIFDQNNSKIYDLKKLYADNFANGPEKVGKEDKTFKWNYNYGSATGWPDPTFGGVLPGTSNGSYPGKLNALSRDASTRVLQGWLRAFM